MTIWILWAVLLGIIGWMGFNYLRLRQAAKIVDNGEFEDLILIQKMFKGIFFQGDIKGSVV